MTAEGIISSWNAGATALFGFSESAILGQEADVLYTPEDRLHKIPAEDRKATLSHSPVTYERWHIRSDGTKFWAQGRIFVIKGDPDTNDQFTWVIRNNNPSLVLTRQAETSEEKYRQLIELSPVPMAIHVMGTVVLANQAAATLMGVSKPEDLLGVNVLSCVHPDSQALAKDRIAQLVESKRQYTEVLEEKLIRFDGKIITVEIVSILIEYGGKPSIQLILHDISERKQAEEALNYSNSLLKTVTNNASLGLLMMDDQGRLTFMNKAAEKITGYPFSDISTRDCPLHDIIHYIRPDGKPYPISECSIGRALPQRSRETGEDIFVRPDGTFYPVRFTASPILKREQPMGTIIEIEDLTERQKTETAYAEASKRQAELEIITAALTAQQAQLVALNQSKDEFISLASHQLRTPATGVKQYIAMVLEGYAGDVPLKLRAFLERAYESNERQLSIVNDLLKVAQIDAGKVQLEKRPMDIAGLVASIIRDHASKFKEREQTIAFHESDQTISIAADEPRLRMVLENIIDNASKYTDAGKTISVSVKRLKDKVRIRIKDQGVGIDEADIDKIFQKFVRLDNPLSTKVGGTGLGLYWAKKIIDLHGGRVTVRSKIGEGSTFIIDLPL